MAWFRKRRSADVSSSDLLARMPPARQISRTQQYVEQARRRHPADEDWTDTRIFPYLELLRGRYDLPLYVGVTGRPAILLCLSAKMRMDLNGLGELIQHKGAHLFLAGHQAGRYGLMRAETRPSSCTWPM